MPKHVGSTPVVMLNAVFDEVTDALLADEWFTVAVKRRMAGIADALDAYGVTPVAELPSQPWSVINGYQAIRDLLDSGVRPRALICLNDRLAFGGGFCRLSQHPVE